MNRDAPLDVCLKLDETGDFLARLLVRDEFSRINSQYFVAKLKTFLPNRSLRSMFC